MSLLTDLEGIVTEDNEIDESSLAAEAGSEIVYDEVYDTSGRWYDIWEAVFKRDDEYVKGMYCVGSTEMQEIERSWDLTIVRPKIVERIVYE